jgi:hypothetical protein
MAVMVEHHSMEDVVIGSQALAGGVLTGGQGLDGHGLQAAPAAFARLSRAGGHIQSCLSQGLVWSL